MMESRCFLNTPSQYELKPLLRKSVRIPMSLIVEITIIEGSGGTGCLISLIRMTPRVLTSFNRKQPTKKQVVSLFE